MILDAAAAILIGGRSRRMKRDKATLDHRGDGETLLEHGLAVLEPLFGQILLSARPGQRSPASGHPVVVDRYPGCGVLGAIASALEASPEPWLFVAACDLPGLSPALIEALAERRQDAEVVMPCWDRGPEPLAAFYAREALAGIRQAIDRGELAPSDLGPPLRIRRLDLSEPGARARILGDPSAPLEKLFCNLNTPEDLDAYRARHSRSARDLTNGSSPGGSSRTSRS